MSRPRVYDVEKIKKDLKKFIDAYPDPILSTFLYQQEVGRTRFYELIKADDELRDLVEIASLKSESNIVTRAMDGEANAFFCSFRLKQRNHGWTDKQEVVTYNNGYGDTEMLSDEERKAEIKRLTALCEEK